MPTNPIKITAEPETDSDICKFTIDIPIAPYRTISCRNKEAALGASLLEALFNIEGIREVLVSGNVITVAKSGLESWQMLGKKIGAAIRDLIKQGQPLIPGDWNPKPPFVNNLYQAVERVLATRVNPGVSTHGGRVELVDVKGTSVYLRLSGGCQGCGAANVTLRQGIEKAIKAQLPEVTEIVDVTDHASGKTPYYKNKRTDGSPL
jgi:Fe-S cluster biogenesis protein NfuA